MKLFFLFFFFLTIVRFVFWRKGPHCGLEATNVNSLSACAGRFFLYSFISVAAPTQTHFYMVNVWLFTINSTLKQTLFLQVFCNPQDFELVERAGEKHFCQNRKTWLFAGTKHLSLQILYMWDLDALPSEKPRGIFVEPCYYMNTIVLTARMPFIFLLWPRESDRYLPAVSHTFMAYSSSSLSQPFIHSPNLKAIQKSSPWLCDPSDKGDDRIGFSCYLFHVK